jgi:hypothetical protein
VIGHGVWLMGCGGCGWKERLVLCMVCLELVGFHSIVGRPYCGWEVGKCVVKLGLVVCVVLGPCIFG